MNLLAEANITLIGLNHYLVLGAVMFVCGLLSILLKRNAIGILMGVELILNAANVNLVAFNRFSYAGTSGAPLLSLRVGMRRAKAGRSSG